MALHGLYILEMKRGDVLHTHFGTYDECLMVSKLNEDSFTCTVRPAHYDDVQVKIAELQEKRSALQFRHDNSPWGMGPQYRQQIEAVEDSIRHFRSFLDAGMTLSEAEDVAMRPDTDDATLLAACKVIDRESSDPFYREISTRIIAHFEERTLEVE